MDGRSVVVKLKRERPKGGGRDEAQDERSSMDLSHLFHPSGATLFAYMGIISSYMRPKWKLQTIFDGPQLQAHLEPMWVLHRHADLT